MKRAACPLCATPTPPSVLAEAAWQPGEVLASIAQAHPQWRKADGACPACVQQALLHRLLEHGEAALYQGIQALWPLNAEDAFGAIPTPLRMHADPRFSAKGVTVALIDTDFYPHPDLTEPVNRIRAWVDASSERLQVYPFGPSDTPRWPGWNRSVEAQWHGLMTSSVAAGNGFSSHGFYSGMAPEAELILIKVKDEQRGIGNARLMRALDWLKAHAGEFDVRVVSISLSGEGVAPRAHNPIDAAVAELAAANISVVVAAGNDGIRNLVPPATAPTALTVGGLDDQNTFPGEHALWHSNYGETAGRLPKPELVAPSIWVVAPLLPGTGVAAEAKTLFARRARNDRRADARIHDLKLITPHYQHVGGTSFAAPIVAGTVACMLEANPALSPRRLRELLIAAAEKIPGADEARQGAGALSAGKAVRLALADQHSGDADFPHSPVITEDVRFLLHDHHALTVQVLGSWDDWQAPLEARELETGLWQADLPCLRPGCYAYKFLLDGHRWLPDPANPTRQHDGLGGFNSLFTL